MEIVSGPKPLEIVSGVTKELLELTRELTELKASIKARDILISSLKAELGTLKIALAKVRREHGRIP
jgi:hypothetical protein